MDQCFCKQRVGHIIEDNDDYFCSWSCMREMEKRGGGSRAEKRERMIQAIMDGLTNREISALLDEDVATINYWRKKIREGKVDA